MTTAAHAQSATRAPRADRIAQILIAVAAYLPILTASALAPSRSAWTNTLVIALAISTTSGILLANEIRRKPQGPPPAVAIIGYSLTALAVPVLLAFVVLSQIHPEL